MFRIKIKDDLKDLEKQLKTLPERMEKAQADVGAAVARHIQETVKERIPDEGGWYDIYRDAIQFYELAPGSWGVSGIAELPFEKIEAATTLLWFQQGGSGVKILANYNPWTIDVIPAFTNGIMADAIVKPASESEVNHHRLRLNSQENAIKSLLSREGITLQENELPKINGKIYADMDFMARRLELGLGGFPRVPHWGPAGEEAKKFMKGSEAENAAYKALVTNRQSEKIDKRTSS